MHSLAMGGYGQFVWSAYGITAIALIAAVALTLRQYFRAIGQLQRMQTENKVTAARVS